MNKFITFALSMLWLSPGVASDPTKPLPADEKTKIIMVRVPTRAICDGWVELGYYGANDIVNRDIEILDSKPPGKHDQEAIDELIAVKSMETPPFTEGVRRETSIVDEAGQEMNVYTFSVGCNKEVMID